MAVTSAEKRSIQPSTPAGSLLPREGRRSLWERLARELGVRRALTRPAWVSRGVVAASGVAFLATLAVARSSRFLEGLVASGATAVLLGLVTRPAAVELRATVGELAEEAVPALLVEDKRSGVDARWTKEAVRAACCRLISEQVGVETFSDDADFFRDLHLE